MKILVGSDWKTTANGFLAATIGAAGPLAAYLAGTGSPKMATAAGLVTLAGVIARVWIGILQNYIQSDPNIGTLASPAVVTVNTTGPVPEVITTAKNTPSTPATT
jgi:hypothetical protein